MNQKFHIMIVKFILLIVSAALLILPAQAAEKKPKERLAVLDLEATHGIDKSLAEALSVIVRDKLHSFGDYQVMSKGDIQAVASREQLLQAMGCDDGSSQCLVDFGRAIGTRFMVAGDISKIGSTYSISLRMLDTKSESAGVTNRVSENCKCEDDALIGAVQDVAAKLVGKPTSATTKKMEEEKKLAEEKKRGEEAEQKRIAEDKRKSDEVIKKAEAEAARRLLEEQKKVDTVKQQLRAEQEKIKLEKAQAETEQKRIAAERSKSSKITSSTSSPQPLGKTLTDPTTGMEFVFVPGGCFMMGDIFGESTSSDNKPAHEVCIDEFFIGKYEVTQGEYKKIINGNPSHNDRGERFPVEQISWDEALDFISILNNKSDKKYRLPTEAEWEYAARSGGRNEKYAGSDFPEDVAWYNKNSGGSSHYVGKKSPNGFGIYDMSGNVWEWCQDYYDFDYYKNSPRHNPVGPPSGSYHVLRGGGFGYGAIYPLANIRYKNKSSYRFLNLGFRLVLPVKKQ